VSTLNGFRLSRRACLRGAGVALALPMLEIMQPRKAAAQAAAPLRFLCVYSPNGFLMPKWTPAGSGGSTYTSSPLLTHLDAYKSDFNVITGLGNYTASISNIFGGSHTRSCGSLLTQCPIASPDVSDDIQNGVSLDQIIAGKVKDQTRFASIEVGSRASSLTGNCEDSFSCAYNNNISWSGPTTPQVKQVNPRDVFNRFFKDLPTSGTPMPAENKDALYQKSILDVVLGRAAALRSKLGKTDLAKLDQYLTAVREVEMRIARLVDGSVASRECTVPAAPTDTSTTQLPFQEHLDTLSDLLALSFQCDIVRVGTYMFEHSFTDVRSFNFLQGVTARHHEITHSANSADQEEKINAFYVQRFAYLLGKLKAASDGGDASVLDNSIVYFTSEFGNAHVHDMRNLPMVVAGKAGGKFKTGQHVVYPLGAGDGQGVDGRGNRDDVQLANLHLTTLHAFDMAQPSFGRDEKGAPMATTTLSELLA
jgi:hypothetical protein